MAISRLVSFIVLVLINLFPALAFAWRGLSGTAGGGNSVTEMLSINHGVGPFLFVPWAMFGLWIVQDRFEGWNKSLHDGTKKKVTGVIRAGTNFLLKVWAIAMIALTIVPPWIAALMLIGGGLVACIWLPKSGALSIIVGVVAFFVPPSILGPTWWWVLALALDVALEYFLARPPLKNATGWYRWQPIFIGWGLVIWAYPGSTILVLLVALVPIIWALLTGLYDRIQAWRHGP